MVFMDSESNFNTMSYGPVAELVDAHDLKS